MNMRPDWDEGEYVGRKPAAYHAPTKWTGPDYPDSIKQKYFGPRPFTPYPATLFHPEKPSIDVKDAEEAAKYGVVYRKATEEERVRYNASESFFDCSGEWRVKPYPKDLVRDPRNLGPGKVFVPQAVDHAKTQTQLMQALVAGQGGGASSTELQALKEQLAEQQEMINRLLTMNSELKPRDIQSKVDPEITEEAHKSVLEELLSEPETKMQVQANEDELEELRIYAKNIGVKVDKRWGIKRINEEIEKRNT